MPFTVSTEKGRVVQWLRDGGKLLIFAPQFPIWKIKSQAVGRKISSEFCSFSNRSEHRYPIQAPLKEPEQEGERGEVIGQVGTYLVQ